jgi:hypothetical protein
MFVIPNALVWACEHTTLDTQMELDNKESRAVDINSKAVKLRVK